MFYTIYETTNRLNGKKYIGKHVTSNVNDDYLGSGLLISKAIKKYGPQNFEKKILYVFDNEDQMNVKEIELINEDVVNDDQYYNIALGGQGGKIALYESNSKYEEICRKISTKAKERADQISKNTSNNHKLKKIGMYGKNHSDEAKRRIGAAHRNKKVSKETRKKLSDANKGRPSVNKNKKLDEIVGKNRAEEIRFNLSVSSSKRCSGSGNPMYGKNHSDEAKQKMRQKALNRKKKKCPHCGGYFSPSTYSRWHNDNCKYKS